VILQAESLLATHSRLSMFEDRFASPGFIILVFGGLLAGMVGGPSAPALAQESITGEKRACENGVAADRYPCRNVDLMSHLSVSALGGEGGVEMNDIWGWTDPETGNRYAIIGRTDGTAFVDVTDPTEPVYLGELPSHSGASSWRDVKVYNNHAFIVSEAADHGMQVFDLTELRSVNNAPATFSETTHYDRFSTAHNIVLNQETGYAYVVGIQGSQSVPESADCGAGLHMIDVRTPDQPQFAGCHNDLSTGGQVAPGYTHDAQCVVYQGPDSDYQGREICFNANESQVNIADVTEKSNPETITNATYPQPGYVHQAWLTKNQRYLLVDDELDEQADNGVDSTRTMVFDVSNLDNPELVTQYTGSTRAIDHNQYVVGNYSYQANYESGLRVLDVSDPQNPGEVAYFDTYPSGNGPRFNGAWSTYPFFENGTVLVSSIGEGLFVLDPQFSPFLSLKVSSSKKTATLQWRISPSARTQRLVVEHRPPGAQSWRTDERVEDPSAGGTASYEYEATELRLGTHQFRVRHVSTAGNEITSRVLSTRILPEEAIELTGFPNPIRGPEPFNLFLREGQRVRIGLYDTMGRRVAQLHEGVIRAGTAQRLSIPRLASGVYFLRIQGESFQRLQKVVVAR